MFGFSRFETAIRTITILFCLLILNGENLKCDLANTATVEEKSLGAEKDSKIKISNPMGMSEDELAHFISVFQYCPVYQEIMR